MKVLISGVTGVLILAFVFTLLACSSGQSDNNYSASKNQNISNKPANIAQENFAKEWKSEFEKTATDLEKHRQLWQEKQIVNYDFVVRKSAPGVWSGWMRAPVLIKVRGDEKISIEQVEKGEDTVVSETDGFEDFDTIDKLFNFLRQELEKGRMLRIKYNKKMGYPEHTSIHGSYEIHGYVNIAIEKFKISKEN